MKNEERLKLFWRGYVCIRSRGPLPPLDLELYSRVSQAEEEDAAGLVQTLQSDSIEAGGKIEMNDMKLASELEDQAKKDVSKVSDYGYAGVSAMNKDGQAAVSKQESRERCL